MAGKSGKPKRLTLQEKLEAMRMLLTGSFATHVMRNFGVSSRLVTKLKSENAALLQAAEKNGRSLQSNSFRGVKFPEIDEKVNQFVELAISAKNPVTKDIIKERALLVKANILRREELGNTQRTQN